MQIINITLYYIIILLTFPVKIGNDSRSRSKRCERTNRHRGKVATINFETFERTSTFEYRFNMPFLYMD